MADRPVVKTKKISRDKLALFLPSHELIKAFEAVTEDVQITLPDAIEAATNDSGSVLAGRVFGRREPVVPQFAQPLDTSQVLAQASFAQRPAVPQNDSDSSRILAGQVFGG